MQISKYIAAINRHAPRLDALGVDKAWLLLEVLYRVDALQNPKGKFGNKRPGKPCGNAYIHWRSKCSKGKADIAKDRLKGTAEGRAYANRVKKFKGLKKQEGKAKTIADRIAAVMDPKTPRNNEWSKEMRALRKEAPDAYREAMGNASEARRKKARSDRGKKAAATRSRNEAAKTTRETQLNSSEEGKLLLRAEKEYESNFGNKRALGGGVKDFDKLDQDSLRRQRAESNLSIADSFRKPSPKQRQYDASRPKTDLNQGKAPTEAWRIKGMNKKVAGNYAANGTPIGVPWSVKVPSAGNKDREIIIAGAEMLPDWMSTKGERTIQLHGTKGEGYRVSFKAGDHERSRRARRLIREIGEGKSKRNLPVEDMRGMIESDDYLSGKAKQRNTARQESKAENERMNSFLQSKGHESWSDVPETKQVPYMMAWIKKEETRKAKGGSI